MSFLPLSNPKNMVIGRRVGTKKNYIAEFDRKNNTVHIRDIAGVKTYTFEGMVIDRLTMTLALAELVKSNSGFISVDFQIVEKNRIRTMTFTNCGARVITTGLGESTATLVHRGTEKRETLTWFGTPPGENQDIVVPLLIEQYKRGKLHARLSAISFTAV